MTNEASPAQVPALSEGLGVRYVSQCKCRACRVERGATAMTFACEMVVCEWCGDKRCLHASNHRAPCAKHDLYAHNAWVERMALRSEPATGRDMPQFDAVVALGAF